MDTNVLNIKCVSIRLWFGYDLLHVEYDDVLHVEYDDGYVQMCNKQDLNNI